MLLCEDFEKYTIVLDVSFLNEYRTWSVCIHYKNNAVVMGEVVDRVL